MLQVIWNEELGEIHVQLYGRGADRDSEKSGKRTIRSRCDILALEILYIRKQ